MPVDEVGNCTGCNNPATMADCTCPAAEAAPEAGDMHADHGDHSEM